MRPVIACLAAAGLASGCIGLVPSVDAPRSVGVTNDGVLLRGVSLADRGIGFVRARPGEATRYGTPTLVGALTRATASVDEVWGGAPMRVGDLSSPTGGRHSRHGSHRTGRDVDVIFYVTDPSGRSVRGRGWLGFGRHGVVRETGTPGGGAGSNDLFFFDDARNWHFVRTLLLDEEAGVQWIFCSRGVKSRLLEYARAYEPDPRAIFRASWVLHQPSRGHPHHDHFHVRVACSADEQLLGCENRGPLWPWIREAIEKPSAVHTTALTDEELVDALLSEIDDGETTEESGS